MIKLLRIIAPIVLFALILPNVVFGAGDWRHDHPSQLILTDATQLYNKNDSSTGLNASITPQTVNVTDAWTYTAGWYEIETWLGQKWIYAPTAIPHEPNYKPKKFQLFDTFFLYDAPFNNKLTKASISPQIIEVIDSGNGFYKVNTWLGEKWLKTPPFENHNAMTDLTQIQKVDEKISLTTVTKMYQGASLGAKVLGALSPQTVLAFEKIDNWYHINSGWVGDAWIQVDDYKGVSWSGVQPTKVDTMVNLTKETEMWSMPVGGKLIGKLSHQQVKAFEQWGNYYHIHTWLGDAWIFAE